VKITETYLKGCFIVQPEVYTDDRGAFFESYQKSKLEAELGFSIDFIQDNQSFSKKNVLRGLHFQEGEHSQAKLVRVVKGEVLDVVVDLRKDSSTFGQHFKKILSDENQTMIFIPKGMAHGFLSISDEVIFIYKCDNYYNKASEKGIIYNDETLNIDWEQSHENIVISEKDTLLPTFKELFS